MKTIVFAFIFLNFLASAFGQEQSDKGLEKIFANQFLKEISNIEFALVKSYNLNYAVGSMSLSVKTHSSFGSSWSDEEWKNKYCLANSIDFGLQQSIRGISFHNTNHFAHVISSDTVEKLKRLYEQTVKILSITERDLLVCVNNSKGLSKDQIIMRLKADVDLRESTVELIYKLQNILKNL